MGQFAGRLSHLLGKVRFEDQIFSVIFATFAVLLETNSSPQVSDRALKAKDY